ncbi:MAG TPA: ABC transporter substrate-binding protein [Beutenbergiaceae bacterium]|nr:ABC transporter substrate-binding protein [Beutenbergiaceae bacterium]
MSKTRIGQSAAGLAAGALVLAACSNGGDGGDGGDGGEVSIEPLTIHANSANSYQPNFNPFSATANHGTRGMIYEPLILVSPMTEDDGQPWLAESMEFNEDGTVATFTLREGVEWSDGEAFDAEDVAFTFNLMTEESAANTAALALDGAEVIDEYTVEVSFTETSFAFEPAIGNTVIVPEHVFAEEDPIEFQNEEPVGTGGFVLDTFDQQLYTLSANPTYWNAEELEVEELHYPANSEQTFTTSLQSGELDWSGGFVANIDDIYVSQDPENRGYWYPGGGLVSLVPNLQNEPFDDPAVREALSLGMDRHQIAEVAMEDYTTPAHPTGLPLPAYEDSLSAETADDELGYDVDQANQILDDAGYEMGSDGVRTTPDGDRMSYNLEIPSSYVDWVTITGLLEEQYAELGIEVSPQGVSFESWVETRNNGTFDITIASVAIGQTPFDMYRSIMSSEYRNDEGSVTANFSRYYTDEADEALLAYANTDEEAEQQAALEDLQALMVEEMPMVPMIQAPNWFQFNTANWEGWPSEEDPYAFGAPFQSPDNILVVQNLTPAG